MKTKIFLIATLLTICHFTSQGQFFKPLLQDDIKLIGKKKSVVLWRIKVIDKTNYFNKRYQEKSEKYDYKNTKEKKGIIRNTNNYYFPTFEIFKHKKNNYFEEPFTNPNSFRYQYDYKNPKWYWSKNDSASVLDEMIVTIVKPDNYFMERIRFLVSSESNFFDNTNFISGGEQGVITTENYYNIKAERKFSVKENAIVYLGRIEIVINNFEEDPHVSFYLNEETKKVDIAWFSEGMPIIFEELKSKLEEEKMKMLYIDKEYRISKYASVPNRPWLNGVYENYSFERSGNLHIIKSNVETCPYSYVKLNYYEMPENYTISFNSKWKEGVTTEGYSLILGNSYKNTYFFNSNGNGSAGVWLKKDGKFDDNPINWINNMFNVGNGETENNHRIEVRGENVKYYANNNLVGEFKMTISAKDWIIGFQVCNKQNVEFSNLVVEEVD